MRAFVAVPMPDAVAADLVALQGQIPVGRPPPEEALHLTLAFLGDVDPGMLEELHLLLEMILPAPFPLRLAGLDLIGGAEPTALAIRAEGGAALENLRNRVLRAARDAGIDVARARFRPHVTLMRLPRPMGPDPAARLGRALLARGDAALAPFTVAGFALYRSDLRPDGARHEMLAHYPPGLAMPDRWG